MDYVIRESEILLVKGEFSNALSVCEKIIRSKDPEISIEIETIEPEILVKVLIVESEAFAGGNNLGSALYSLTNARELAIKHNMAYLVALVNLHMASVQVILIPIYLVLIIINDCFYSFILNITEKRISVLTKDLM